MYYYAYQIYFKVTKQFVVKSFVNSTPGYKHHRLNRAEIDVLFVNDVIKDFLQQIIECRATLSPCVIFINILQAAFVLVDLH